MNRKIVFLDIDGTLVQAGSNVPSEAVVKSIQKVRENGHYVFLCTGRNYGMLSPLLDYKFDGYIASSGGYICCDKEIIYDEPMTEQQKDTMFSVLEKNGIFRTVECKDTSYTDDSFKEFLREHNDCSANSELLRWREQIETSLGIKSMSEFDGQAVYKVVIMLQKEEQLEEAKTVLGEDFNFCIQDRDQYGIINGEIVNRKFDKGKAVKRVCDYYGINVSDCIAVGDSANDREMLEVAGISVCMENGSDSMKKIADVICPTVAEDGIVWVLKKYGLLEKD